MYAQFEYYRPASVAEMAQMFGQYGDAALLYAGGTDLLVQLRAGLAAPKRLVDVKGIGEFNGIEEDAEWISVGSACRFADIEANAAVLKWARPLAEASSQVGSVQIRLKGTLGGNVQTASPAGDGLCALWGLDAEVELVSAQGRRRMPLASFVTGPRKTALAEGEAIARFYIPKRGWAHCRFFKVGRRNALAISVANGVVALDVGQDGVIRDARIALGAVAPTPIRVTEAEQLLVGKRPDAELADRVCDLVQCGVRPITDVRASAEYRAYIAGVQVKREILSYMEGVAK